ncbi:hypothetical protein GCM10009836_35310 [Pseudonocardia ailaonensis]|uniref:Uncharacterized protein n=1 Tax=Pseudonocardia ailaonensis TaxID=367279 RepID=A0ABN2N4G0_9PSEU
MLWLAYFGELMAATQQVRPETGEGADGEPSLPAWPPPEQRWEWWEEFRT